MNLLFESHFNPAFSRNHIKKRATENELLNPPFTFRILAKENFLVK